MYFVISSTKNSVAVNANAIIQGWVDMADVDLPSNQICRHSNNKVAIINFVTNLGAKKMNKT